MEAVVQEIDVEELTSIFDIPETMRNSRVEVTIRPIEEVERDTTVAQRIEAFMEKHTHESFIEHLKSAVAHGEKFDFDVQKLIDGTETEEDKQIRYRAEKQAWAKSVWERMERGEEC